VCYSNGAKDSAIEKACFNFLLVGALFPSKKALRSTPDDARVGMSEGSV